MSPNYSLTGMILQVDWPFITSPLLGCPWKLVTIVSRLVFTNLFRGFYNLLIWGVYNPVNKLHQHPSTLHPSSFCGPGAALAAAAGAGAPAAGAAAAGAAGAAAGAAAVGASASCTAETLPEALRSNGSRWWTSPLPSCWWKKSCTSLCTIKINHSYPHHPCRVYLTTFSYLIFMVNVGK